MKKYEALYILADSLRGDEAEKAMAVVKSEIEKAGGVVKGEKKGGRRSFAKPMKKQQGGYYYEILFELAPEKLGALQERHKLDANVFRVITLAAVREKPKSSPPPAEAVPAEGGV